MSGPPIPRYSLLSARPIPNLHPNSYSDTGRQPQAQLDLSAKTKPGLANSTVLSHPELFTEILYKLYNPPTDYGVISHLIPLTSNLESTAYSNTLSLKLVCKTWRDIISFSPATPFQSRKVKTEGVNHLLHIPFLAWLAINLRAEMKETYCGQTNFPQLRELAEDAGFMADNMFISHPAVDKILITIVADYHDSFTSSDLGGSFRHHKYTFRLSQRFSEDVFLIRNEKGVTVKQVYRVIMDALTAYYNFKKSYMLWMVEVGFVDPDVDVIGGGDSDMTRRSKLKLFEQSKRCVRIHPTDGRLDVRNDHHQPRILLPLPEETEDDDEFDDSEEEDDGEEDGDRGDSESERDDENGEGKDGTDKMDVDEESCRGSDLPLKARLRSERSKRSSTMLAR
ncbi:hypothetical protein TWF694_005435 [Orbilia ellipsospora]|uniref:F-box domain-containing protein n=1 Tax=Orbilia ellipsospora TaxID=2528407 RepID=A0AAV9WUN4_9PEZI